MTVILCKRNLGDIDKFEEFIELLFVGIPQRYLDFDELENHTIRKVISTIKL